MEVMNLPLKDPVAIFAVVLCVILFAPLVMEKLRLPGMVGLILAGVLVGPHGINLLAREGAIDMLGQVGLIYILFLAGVETDLGMVRKNRGQGLTLGLLLFSIPFITAFSGGVGLLKLPLATAILFGSLFSSHTLVSYPIVSRFGLSKTRSVTAAVTATIICDTLAMLILAVISASSHGGIGLLFWLRLTFMLCLLVFLGLFVVPKATGRFFSKLQPENGVTEFIYVLTVLFILAVLSKFAGLEAIIGAFVAGLALNSLIPEKSILMNRLSFVGNSLFIPFFLISTGMLVDVRSFATEGSTLFITLLMVTIILVSKWVVSRLMRWRYGYSRDEANLVFGLTINKAAATLATVLVGYRLGLFPVSILTGTIVMIITTCLIGPLVTNSAAKSIAKDIQKRGTLDQEAPERIMVVVSNPDRNGRLMDLAVLLHSKESNDPIYPVNVVKDSSESDRDVANSERLLAKTVAFGVAAGVNVIPVTRVSYNVAEGIVQAARDSRISMIVTGAEAEPSSIKRPFGRVVDQIVRSSHQLVFVNRVQKPINLYSSIVVVIPPLSERQNGFGSAVSLLKGLASELSARLSILTLRHAADELESSFAAVKPALPFHVINIESWKDMQAEASRHSSGTIFAFLNVRQGNLAWQPAVDRLPGALIEAFPEIPILSLYLAEESEAAQEERSLDSNLFLEALARDRVRIWKDSLALADAIRALLSPSFPDAKALLPRLCANFLDIAHKQPVELKPGIVLLHSHFSEIDEPAVFFGIAPSGIHLLSIQEPIKILVLLMAPEQQPPEEHLKALASLASTIMNKEFVEKLLVAQELSEIRAAGEK
jgi:Kef-type K+ transport system membrane component KefB